MEGGYWESAWAGDSEHAAQPCAGDRSPGCDHYGCKRSCPERQQVRAEGPDRMDWASRGQGQYSQHTAILGLPKGQVSELQCMMLPQVHRTGAQAPTSKPPQPHIAPPARRHPAKGYEGELSNPHREMRLLWTRALSEEGETGSVVQPHPGPWAARPSSQQCR